MTEKLAIAHIRGDGVKYYYSRCNGCGIVRSIHEDTLNPGLPCDCGGRFQFPMTESEYDKYIHGLDDVGLLMGNSITIDSVRDK